MLFRQIFDPKLAQYAYLIGCQQTKEAIIIDPERDIGRYVGLAEAEGLNIVAVTETHIHADFLSGSREFAERFDTKLFLSDEGDADWDEGEAGERGGSKSGSVPAEGEDDLGKDVETIGRDARWTDPDSDPPPHEPAKARPRQGRRPGRAMGALAAPRGRP